MKRKDDKKELWAYSFDNEYYVGSYNSREEAIAAAKEEVETDKDLSFPNIHTKLYTGMQMVPELHWTDMAEYVIDSIQDNLDDDCGGTWSENFANDQISREDEDLLDERLNETIRQWIKDCNIVPGFFLIDIGTVLSIDISDWTKGGAR